MFRTLIRGDGSNITRKRSAMFLLIGFLAISGSFIGSAPSAQAGGGFCHSPLAREGNDGSVTLEGFCFSPIVMRVNTHDAVKFRNTDPVPHLVTGVANAWGSSDQTVAPNTSTEVTFDAPGLYPYTCLLHPGMTGVIVVGDGVIASSPGVPAIKALSASSAPGSTDSAPAAASTSARNDASDSRWLYAGMGALGGLVVAGLAFVAASARRSGRS